MEYTPERVTSNQAMMMRTYYAYKGEAHQLPTTASYIDQSALWHSAISLLLSVDKAFGDKEEETKARLASLKAGR